MSKCVDASMNLEEALSLTKLSMSEMAASCPLTNVPVQGWAHVPANGRRP
jgi:hypothetical protein